MFYAALILAVLFMGYHGWSGILWTVVLGGFLLAAPMFTGVAGTSLLCLWIGFGVVALLCIPSPVRRLLLTSWIIKLVRNTLPNMSQTEREALEAGTVSWDGELFSGAPDWSKLLDRPKPALTEEEQAFMDGPVDEVCRMTKDWEVVETHRDLTPEVWQYLKDKGFFGMIIPKKYGGLEFSGYAHSTVVMKLACRSISTAVTVMVPNSLGPAELLLHYGTEEQKDEYLPKLANGEHIPCFALTSPVAGSDAGAIPDKGIICKGKWKGKTVVGMKLTWNKRYITLCPVATLLGLAFKMYDPEHLLGDQEELGITCALIPTDTKGVHHGDRHRPLNAVFMNGTTHGEDVFLPLDHIIGGPDYIGKGWKMLVNCLSVGRSVSLPALSTAAGKVSTMHVGAYSRIRKQFNVPIGQFEGVEEALANIGGLTYIMDSARKLTCGMLDLGEKPAVPSAILKYHNTEAMRHVVASAMDIAAGRGVIRGPRNVLANVYTSIPIAITVEGANILTRSLIIYGQGAMLCHPYVFKEMDSAKNPDQAQGLLDFDAAFFGHLGRYVHLSIRATLLGLSRGLLHRPPDAPGMPKMAKRYYQHMARFSAQFALLSDFSLAILGGSLKFREKLSGRLGDCLSYLYLGTACLKHYHDDGYMEDHKDLVEWSLEYCLYQIQEAIYGVLNNFPVRPVAWILRLMIFPIGRTYNEPDDYLEKDIARIMLEPCDGREELISHAYRSNDPKDPTGRVENAFLKVIAAAEAEKKVSRAVKKGLIELPSHGKVRGINMEMQPIMYDEAVKQNIITAEEKTLLAEADDAVWDAIQVDIFRTDKFAETLMPEVCKLDNALPN